REGRRRRGIDAGGRNRLCRNHGIVTRLPYRRGRPRSLLHAKPRPMKTALLPSGKDRMRLASAAIGLGLFLTAIDIYWGNGRIHGYGHGILALALLLVGSAASQTFEYARYAGLLRRPRLPDAYL